MSRTRATQLALVNWRGVFYEGYELSETVTALEGANGAGKTTVLIAAFIALLPDMSHLRFTNVGESAGSAGDRGIWGRLGKTGRPSYTVLDLVLANGERLLAGVHLERRTEPAVEPTPFLIFDFPPGDDLQELLLLRGNHDEAVPELAELREHAARFGARLHQCPTAKAYFAELFDRGVTPLRLDGDAERAKLSEMLRTSMTGGMSRVLTNGLRAFLLKEERGLADTLRRMRSNIDACRRTRAEVDGAHALESEISRVYEAGQEMFSAAVHATEQAAQEATKRIAEAEEKVRNANGAVTAARTELESTRGDHALAQRELRSSRETLERARDRLRALDSAHRLHERVERVKSEVEALRRAKGWRSDLSCPRHLDALRHHLSERRDAARDEATRHRDTCRKFKEERERLERAQGALSPGIAGVAHALGAKPVAARFEDIAIEDAGTQQARLGPLVNAIVVDDPQGAARAATGIKDRPETLWLASEAAIAEAESAAATPRDGSSDTVLVAHGPHVWRVTDVPERPVLGRPARQSKLDALERDCEGASREAASADERRRKVEAELRALEDLRLKLAEIDRDRQELATLGIEDASETALEAARARLSEREAAHHGADARSRALDNALGGLEERLRRGTENRDRATQELTDHRALGEPARRRWERLRSDADSDGLLAHALAPDTVQRAAGRGSGNLYSEALRWAHSLHDRLSEAEPESEITRDIDRLCRLDDRSGDDYLRAWREVRAWLHRRVPAQIAQMDDPLEALTRLRGHLADLRTRLATQERELQGNSADVANAIGTQTRQARREIERLNKSLEKVRFGSIAGVRLQLQRVAEMEKVLEALRAGEDQGTLFAPDLPFEEAMNELLLNFAGRRAQGHRLLDYREYVDPRIQVRRNTASAWEIANPTRISTGESIGIGAALMMVVLTAWERSESLRRAQSAHSTLRVLLLDEANRLDRENLAVLFDLCRALDLQLLIAAPEVAQAQGNTTYRLVRLTDDEGEELVRRDRQTHRRRTGRLMWDSDENRLAMVELFHAARLRRRESQHLAWEWLSQLPWTRGDRATR